MSGSRRKPESRPPSRPTPPATGGNGGTISGEAFLEVTGELLRRVRSGDEGARASLLERYLPVLQRWARGRLPRSAGSVAETNDLVQLTVMRALRRVDAFEPRREGAFLAYLRKILLNTIREEMQKGSRRRHEPLPESRSTGDPGVSAGANDTLALYEKGLQTLSDRQREAAILRLEFGYTYSRIAEAVECSSADAARMIVNRALVKIANAMTAARDGGR
jgi:RNA polymerase sigma-70 factor (ECF subfamily)